MKRLIKAPVIFITAGYFFWRFVQGVFQPLKDMPVPNFNNEYDSTML
jgi:hypothetical protein